MRLVFSWRLVSLGALVAMSFPASQRCAADDSATLRFRPVPASQLATETPSIPKAQPGAEATQAPVVPPVSTTPTTATAPMSPRSFPRLGATAAVYAQPTIEPQVTNQTRQALGFYGGNSARATLSQLPRRAPLQHAASPSVRPQAKPFEVIHREPTVSPYLNLYRDDDGDESAPSYYAFVRPQQEQLDANRRQQREIQHLRGQIQGMSSSIAGPRYQSAGVPATGGAARYMDTAQFYGGWRR